MNMNEDEKSAGRLIEEVRERPDPSPPCTPHNPSEEKKTPLFGFDVFSLPIDLFPESRTP
jgi:hypothetical protein